LFENTRRVLEDLSRAGTRLGIISNFDSRIDDVLRELDLARYFSSVHISSRVGAAKPNVEIFRHAIAAANLPAHQCWHLGDNPEEDFEGARSAGMRAVLVRR
jgi:putative hydrolase of the HAD superfamily